jgi:hypothetical protein
MKCYCISDYFSPKINGRSDYKGIEEIEGIEEFEGFQVSEFQGFTIKISLLLNFKLCLPFLLISLIYLDNPRCFHRIGLAIASPYTYQVNTWGNRFA